MSKVLGASKIITGQYYPIGEEYQVVAKTIDVTTGKVIKAEKLKYPKSESTSKLDAIVVASSSQSLAPSAGTKTNAPSSVPSDGPLVIQKCRVGCYGACIAIDAILTSPEDGTLKVDREGSRFVVDDGTKRIIERIEVAGTRNELEPIIANIPTKIVIIFMDPNGVSKFSLFELRYSYNGKTYLIKSTPTILK